MQEGQVLVRLDTGKSEEGIALSVSQAKLNVLNAQKALDDIYSSVQMDAALALQAVEEAEQALDDLNNTELQQAEAQFKKPILEQYERESSPYFATARLWDDGILDPAQTRMALALAFSVTLNAPFPNDRYGTFRM